MSTQGNNNDWDTCTKMFALVGMHRSKFTLQVCSNLYFQKGLIFSVIEHYAEVFELLRVIFFRLFHQFVRRIGSKALQCSVFQYLLGLLKSEEFSRSTVSYKCFELVTCLHQCVP